MKHAPKWIAISLICVICLGFMIEFKQSHSAKETLREEGIRYYRMGKYDAATDSFTKALSQKEWFSDHMDQDIYFYLADGEMKQENYEEAITYYDKLLELGNKGVELYLNLGMCLEQTGHPKKAYKYYKKAVKADAQNSDIYYYLCSTSAKLGKTDECKQYAEKGFSYFKDQLSEGTKKIIETKDVSKVTSTQLKELKKCGQLSYLSGNYEDANAYYKLLDQAGETDAKLYIGHCLAEAGEFEKALESLNQYEEANGISAFSIAKKVYCYMELKQYKEALKLVDVAIGMEDQKSTQELLYEKGVALERTGDFDGAFDVFAKYIEEYPKDAKGKREYDFLVTRISDDKAKAAGVNNGN